MHVDAVQHISKHQYLQNSTVVIKSPEKVQHLFLPKKEVTLLERLQSK